MDAYVNNFDNNYFMKPTYIDGFAIYPIKYKDYNKFSQLANKYLVNDLKNLNNISRINFDVLKFEGKVDRFEKFNELPFKTLFEWFIYTIKETDNNISNFKIEKQNANMLLNKIKEQARNKNISQEELYSIEGYKEQEEITKMLNNINDGDIANEIYVMLEMVLHNKVMLNNITNEINIINSGEVIGSINENNFEEFRDIVMKSNLIYKPLIGFNKISNDSIIGALKAKSKNSKEVSEEAMLGIVSLERNISDEALQEYTWYRLRFDFELINRKHLNDFYFILKGAGCKEVDIVNLNEKVELYKNPYDGLLNKHNGYNSLDNKLKKG